MSVQPNGAEVLRISSLSHAYGETKVLHDVDLEIAPGQIVGLVGPSGCGKSTLLRAILGTLKPTRGSVHVYRGREWDGAAKWRKRYLKSVLTITDEHRVRLAEQLNDKELRQAEDGDIRGELVKLDDEALDRVLTEEEARRLDYVPVERPGRDRGIVYQRYSLFPHLKARENVALGLMLQHPLWERVIKPRVWRRIKKEYLDEATALLERLHLGHAAGRYPHELSGGMRQRVAVAQALITKPAILLLDEPFGALDEATREALQRLLLTLYQENRAAIAKGEQPAYTIFIVTHELNEAIFVGDRVIGLSQYWDWKGAGFSACPGATIVYDDQAPTFSPEEEREAHLFKRQKLQILGSVFDPETCQERQEFVRYWARVHEDAAQPEQGGPA